MKRKIRLNSSPERTAFGLGILFLLLIAGLVMLIYLYIQFTDRLAILTVVSGEVTVSDGITDSAARDGPLFSRNKRTLLKTRQGVANLQLRDGSTVILDSGSTIEFNQQKGIDIEKSYAYNMIKGRMIVMGDVDSLVPTQFIIDNDIVIRGYQAVMGIEVSKDGNTRGKVDCLVGKCKVNGTHLLASGQHAQIGLDNTILVTQSDSFMTWISLGNAGKPGPALSNLLLNFGSAVIQRYIPTISPPKTEQEIPDTGIHRIIFTPTSTPMRVPTKTPSLTSTYFTIYATSIGQATQPRGDPEQTATPSQTLSPVAPSLIAFSKTLTPVATLFFTLTSTLKPTDAASPQPLDTPTSTQVPSPPPTSAPIPIPIPPTATSPPPATDVPTKAPKPTKKPKKTQVPTLVETTVEIPIQTDTPAPTGAP